MIFTLAVFEFGTASPRANFDTKNEYLLLELKDWCGGLQIKFLNNILNRKAVKYEKQK